MSVKLSPQQAKILAELRKEPLTTADFMNRSCCPRCHFESKGLNMVNFSQRITELKRLGYNIVSKPLRSNLWLYELKEDAHTDERLETTKEPSEGSAPTDERLESLQEKGLGDTRNTKHTPQFGMKHCINHQRNHPIDQDCPECIKERLHA